MTIKHTPGPWRVGVLDNNAFVLDDSTDPQPIAAVIRNAADAKLLAAAPELADALEAFLNVGCGCSLREIDSGHKTDCHFAGLRDSAESALRAAGRLP